MAAADIADEMFNTKCLMLKQHMTLPVHKST